MENPEQESNVRSGGWSWVAGMFVGIGAGTGVGVALGNIPLGVSVGAAAGAAVGLFWGPRGRARWD